LPAQAETGVILTVSPVRGAWTRSPSPMYMPTWPGALGVPVLPGMKIRSPRRSWPGVGTATPMRTCSMVVRGMATPAAR
jgi:hypothetical protein